MASGRLGKADLAATTNTDLYTVPTGAVSTVNVCFANRNSTSVTIRLAIRSGTIADTDYLEYETTLPGNGILERTAVVMSAAEVVVCRASGTGVSVRVHGFEEAA